MSRRVARETALQILYQVDISGEKDYQQALENWALEFAVPARSKEFTKTLVAGTLQYLSEIDAQLAATAHEWSIDRMSVVDRNIMRLAGYEMLYAEEETPHRVVLNEAVEMAKKFGGEDSAKFINGILDKLLDTSERIKKQKKFKGENCGVVFRD
ncbi:MAG: transcription antitermination factor NusB [Desulfitobacteriia bacterium]|jgi:N utilization substance protein B